MTQVLHYNQVAADALATDINVLENVGTITLGSNTKFLYGMYFQAVSSSVETAAEAVQGSWTVNAASLAPQTLNFICSRGTGGGCATNEGQLVDNGLFLPWYTTNNHFANAQITSQFEGEIAFTTEYAAQFFTMESEDQLFNMHVLQNFGTQPNAIKTPTNFAHTATEPDWGNALAETFPENLTIPAWVDCVTAIGIGLNNIAAPTTAEHTLGYIELGGTYPGLYPMKIPIPAFWATLGTPVDRSESGKQLILPMCLPGTHRNETIIPTINLQQVLTATGCVSN